MEIHSSFSKQYFLQENQFPRQKYGANLNQVEKDNMVVSGRKTALGGALNMGLIASNTDQLLFIATSNYENFNGLDITKMSI